MIPPKGFVMDDDLDSPSAGRIRWEDEQPREGRRSQETRREEVVELPSSVFRANASFSAQVLPSTNRYDSRDHATTVGGRDEGRGKESARMERTMSTDSERNFVLRMKEKYAIEREDREGVAREGRRVSSVSRLEDDAEC